MLQSACAPAKTLVRRGGGVCSANMASNDAIVSAPAAPLARPTPPTTLANTSQRGSQVAAHTRQLQIGSAVPQIRNPRLPKRSASVPEKATKPAVTRPDKLYSSPMSDGSRPAG